jgi:membrane-associated phospholipid phosphatase
MQVLGITGPLMAKVYAAPQASEMPLRLGWQDAAWISGGLAIQIPAQIRYRNMHSADTGSLNRDDLIYMDRWAAGTYSPTAGLASDILVLPFCALPVALTAFDAYTHHQGISPIVTDAVIFSEALAFSSALSLLVRSLQIHPRPLVYGKDVPADKRLSGEASGSFHSGHANAAFLAAVYLSYTYPLRHPEFQGQAWLWTGSLAIATTVASLRVAAGKHFPSDVIVGAAAGAFFGWVFPYLHRVPKRQGTTQLHLQQDQLGVHPMLVWTF